MTAESFDAVVLGAGESGAVIASLALEDGRRVAMVYREPYGSTCLNVGCVPSKYLIHRARVAHLVRTSARFGVHGEAPRVDLAAIVAAKNAMVEGHRAGSFRGARSAEGLTLIEGSARFRGPGEVQVGDRVLRGERIFIATGARPALPKIEGLDGVRYYTNDDVMDLTEVPERLIVVGGGYIACELGQMYARFGSRVVIVQSRPRLLPNEEPDVSAVLGESFAREGIEVLAGQRASKVARSGDGLRLAVSSDAGERAVEGTHLLVASGRRPNADGLALDAAGIRSDERGFVVTDEFFETTAPGTFAAGDVLGKQPFTRVVQEEAKAAYANAFRGARVRLDRGALGHAVFTDPEIASVGMTEAAARESGLDVVPGYVTFDEVTKADLIGETAGFVKYVVDRTSRRLVGVHVIGPQAADLVYSATLLMRNRRPLDDLAQTVGIFPTLQEVMEGSARGLLARLAGSPDSSGASPPPRA